MRLAAVYQKMGIRIECSRQADTVVEDVALPGEFTQRTNPEVVYTAAGPHRRGPAVPGSVGSRSAGMDERSRWHRNEAERNPHDLIEGNQPYHLDPMEEAAVEEKELPLVANPL